MVGRADLTVVTRGLSRLLEISKEPLARPRPFGHAIRSGFAASLVVLGVGCANDQGSVRPNVILISLDTLRADHVGCYGYPRPTTPAIDAFAAEGTVFERAVANAPWTLPSHASILTGLQPRLHGVRSHETALPKSIPTLTTVLGANGYRTMAIVNSKQLLARYGLDRGFHQFEYFSERIEKRRVRSGSNQVDLAVEWISQVAEGPFFLFLHNYDIHSDYDPSPRFASEFVHPYTGSIRGTTSDLMSVRRGELALTPDDLRHLVDLYDAGIREIDAEVGRLFDFLAGAGIVENTIVILTSDHGEEFLEHGDVLHGRTMHREVLEVPLIIGGPGVPEGHRVGQLVQPSDIFATVVELTGLRPESTDTGKSLVEFWADTSNLPSVCRVFAEADHNRESGNDTLEMVQTSKFKLVSDRSNGKLWLYDCIEDPSEKTDVSAQRPDVVDALLKEIRSLDDGRRVGDPISLPTGAEREALRSLGYLQ